MSDYSDLPIKHDDPLDCAVCGIVTIHNRTIYKDIEYRTCTRCHTKTQLKPDSDHTLKTVSSKRDDTSIPKYNLRRSQDHGGWRKKWRKGEEDE